MAQQNNQQDPNKPHGRELADEHPARHQNDPAEEELIGVRACLVHLSVDGEQRADKDARHGECDLRG